MAGELVPLVLFPKFTTLSGQTTFTTVALDVSSYQSARVGFWRGPVMSNGAVAANFEESMDQLNWTSCPGAPIDWDPGQSTEGQADCSLTKQWFRMRVALSEYMGGGTDVSTTCWALGTLQRREQ